MSAAPGTGALAPVIRLPVAGDRIDEIFGANGLLAANARKQGLSYEVREGRLIRTRSDWGVVVILDERVLSRSWGGAVFASLPRAKRLGTVAEVKAFFAAMRPSDSSGQQSFIDAMDGVR